MISALAKKVIAINNAKSALLSYEDIVDKLMKITTLCEPFPNQKDATTLAYKRFFYQYLNNVGDPFDTDKHMSSKPMEKDVIRFFSNLFKLEEDNIGGYIEWDTERSELFALHVAIKRFGRQGIFILPQNIDPRILNGMYMFRIPKSQIRLIKTTRDGMDLQELSRELHSLKDNSPVTLWLSLGDVNGTIDNLNQIKSITESRPNVHIHFSCSHAAIALAFTKNDYGIHFENPLDSISIPLSSFFNVPISGGIVLVRRNHVLAAASHIQVIKGIDSTIPGSRIGHLQILLWVAIRSRGVAGIKEDISRMEKNCHYVMKHLQACNIDVECDPLKSCIIFRKNVEHLNKWKLQIDELNGNVRFDILPQMTKPYLDEFLKEFLGHEPPQLENFNQNMIPTMLPPSRELSREDNEFLDNFSNRLDNLKHKYIGYPINVEFSSKHLNDIKKLFEYEIKAKATESINEDLHKTMSDLLRITPSELHMEMTPGGSWSNLLAMFVARENFQKGIIYNGSEAHYSIDKMKDILNMEGVNVPSLSSGEIDYDALKEEILKNIEYPVILNLNIGTTMKGAIDNIKRAKNVILEANVKDYYIHCDAALDGGFLPLICKAPQMGFDLGVDSISVSTHKYLGVPIPTSLFAVRKSKITEEFKLLCNNVISIKDEIIPVLMWYAINRQGTIPPGTEAKMLLGKAEYVYKKMTEMSFPCFLNDFSNIVVFTKPSQAIIDKYSLAVVGNLAHVILMHHVSYEIIDEFISDIKHFMEQRQYISSESI